MVSITTEFTQHGDSADLLWDVPQPHGTVLCSRQKHVSGRMRAQTPDRPVHVSIHQDVARCILLPDLNDLRIPGSDKDFPLTEQRAHARQNTESRPGKERCRFVTHLPPAD